MKLGDIVSNIRTNDAYSDHRAELECMGFDYGKEKVRRGWDCVKCALLAHQKVFGHLMVHFKFVIPAEPAWPEEVWGMKLGRIAGNIKHNGAYSEHMDELQGMGFPFESNKHMRQASFDAVKRALVKYKCLFGHLRVPKDFVVPATPKWPKDLWGVRVGALVFNPTYFDGPKLKELKAMGLRVAPKVESQATALGAAQAPASPGEQADGETHATSAMQAGPKTAKPEGRRQRGRPPGGAQEKSERKRTTEETKWKSVKQALLAYKSVFGDLAVRQKYVVPDNKPEWPYEAWGLKLGRVVECIKKGQYGEHKAELEEMGFFAENVPPKTQAGVFPFIILPQITQRH